jgi:YD repeat-containing protein
MSQREAKIRPFKAGRQTRMTVAGQPDAICTYDDANRLTQITQGTSTVMIGYDAASRRTSRTLPDNIVVQYDYSG